VPAQSKPGFKPWNFERVFLALLVVATTLFLIRETGLYLNATEGGGTGLIKAMIGEGIVIALSWLHFSTLKLKLARVILLGAFFAFNLWTLTGSVVSAGESSITRVEIVDQTIRELESTIASKETLRQGAQTQDRKTLARKYEIQIDELRQKLSDARAERLKVQSVRLTQLNTVQSVWFRLIVMSANALLISQLSGLKSRERATVAGL
jgi:hypothetical protein